MRLVWVWVIMGMMMIMMIGTMIRRWHGDKTTILEWSVIEIGASVVVVTRVVENLVVIVVGTNDEDNDTDDTDR